MKVDTALAAGQLGALEDEVSAHVAAIHPDLEWGIGNGLHAEHVLCVTSAGVMEHRALPNSGDWRAQLPMPRGSTRALAFPILRRRTSS